MAERVLCTSVTSGDLPTVGVPADIESWNLALYDSLSALVCCSQTIAKSAFKANNKATAMTGVGQACLSWTTLDVLLFAFTVMHYYDSKMP